MEREECWWVFFNSSGEVVALLKTSEGSRRGDGSERPGVGGPVT
jgi:hypothetical protein